MDTLHTNTTIISSCLCVQGTSVWCWYRDYLSGFQNEATQRDLLQHDIEIREGKSTRIVQTGFTYPTHSPPMI